MQVKLKSYFGIHPVICFFIKIALIIILCGVLPSFFTNTRQVFISTNIHPVNVSVDGATSDISPCNIRLGSGVHTVEFSYGGCALGKFELRLKNSLFYSWFFPYSQKAHYILSVSDEYIRKVEENFINDSVLYSTLYHTDRLHINKPYFSYYRTSLPGDEYIKPELVNLAKKFIANVDCADDYKQNFDKDFAFTEAGDVVLEGDSDLGYYDISGEIDLGGVKFIKLSDKLAISANVLKSSENYRNAVEFAQEFSHKNSLRARIPSLDEYKRLVHSKGNEVFVGLKDGVYEYTSTVFLPFGGRLSAEELAILGEYSVHPNYRLFCFSAFNLQQDDKTRLSLVAGVGFDDDMKSAGFRLAVEL